MMKQRIYLKRKAGSVFKSIQKGLYPNAIIKIENHKYEKGEYLILNFQLLAHLPLEETNIKFQLVFDRTNIPEVIEGENILDVGHPNLSHLLDNYLDFDEDDYYLTGEYGKMWLLLQKRITVPNGLGETNLSQNWELMTDEEIDALTYA